MRRIPAAGQRGGRIPVHIPGVPLARLVRRRRAGPVAYRRAPGGGGDISTPPPPPPKKHPGYNTDDMYNMLKVFRKVIRLIKIFRNTWNF